MTGFHYRDKCRPTQEGSTTSVQGSDNQSYVTYFIACMICMNVIRLLAVQSQIMNPWYWFSINVEQISKELCLDWRFRRMLAPSLIWVLFDILARELSIDMKMLFVWKSASDLLFLVLEKLEKGPFKVQEKSWTFWLSCCMNPVDRSFEKKGYCSFPFFTL